jgi:GNAT superfamily N-acetyltransferase
MKTENPVDGCISDRGVTVTRVRTAHPSEMRSLYEAGGWWEDEWNDEYLADIVARSYAFVVAVEPKGSWVGMGRLISDGVSDAYLQDIVVLPGWEGRGIGSALVRELLGICREHSITWIGVIAGPRTEYFYRRFGFAKMNGYIPMRYEK